MNTTLTNAVNDKQVLRIDYDPGLRIVEPHAHGENVHDNELVRVFQRSGASSSGEHKDWKLLRVDRIKSLEVLDEHFSGPRPGYRRGDKAMTKRIFAQL